MSASQNDPHTSDNESAERPVREQLRKASIAVPDAATQPDTSSQSEQPRGRLQRKRSYDDEDAEEEEPAHKTRHGRKRSRENPPEEKGHDQPAKRKSDELERSTERATANGSSASGHASEPVAVGETENAKSKRSKVNDKGDDPRPTTETGGNESQTGTANIPVGSGFANTAAASPFASLAASKSPSEQPQTTTSAFASSGFGALAGSSTSAFGALGQNKSLSSFASPSPSASADENAKPETKSAFGGSAFGASPFAAAGSSAFGAGTSGFGKLGNGFGGGFGGMGGSKLTSFASSGTPGVIGSSKTSIRPFGAPAEEEEDKSGDEDDGDAGAKSPKPVEEDKKDERFFEQEIETGEEDETTEYTCRAKLYNFVDKKEWKERGLGVVRLNVLNPKPSEDSTAPKARLVMRADGSHRVILNTPIQKGLNFGTVKGERPVGGYIYFMGSIDGQPKLELLQLKVRQQFALELWDHIADLQKQM